MKPHSTAVPPRPPCPRRRKLWVLALTAASVVLTPGRGRAEDSATILGLISGGIALAGANAMFSTYDIVVAVNEERPSLGWSIAEAIVASPQAIAANAITMAVEHSEDDEAAVIIPVILSQWTSTLATHGIWSAAGGDAVDPGGLMQGSLLIGLNTPITTAVLGRAFSGRLSSMPMAIAGMLSSAPGVITGTHQLIATDSHRPGWIAMTAWSGALLLHGVASVIYNATEEEDTDDEEYYLPDEEPDDPDYHDPYVQQDDAEPLPRHDGLDVEPLDDDQLFPEQQHPLQPLPPDPDYADPPPLDDLDDDPEPDTNPDDVDDEEESPEGRRRPDRGVPFAFAPSIVSNGVQFVPGILVVGTF